MNLHIHREFIIYKLSVLLHYSLWWSKSEDVNMEPHEVDTLWVCMMVIIMKMQQFL
jgi:hypothetical protein